MQIFGGTLCAAISLREMRLKVLPLVAECEAQFSSDAIRVLSRIDVRSDPRLNPAFQIQKQLKITAPRGISVTPSRLWAKEKPCSEGDKDEDFPCHRGRI
jgi:hypothetical protein